MRADMGGAATVCASVVTAAALKLPVNIIGEFYDTVLNVFTAQPKTDLNVKLQFIQGWLLCVKTCPVEKPLNLVML